MKKLIILLTVLISFTYCNGPRSGPLDRQSFKKGNQNQNQNQNQNLNQNQSLNMEEQNYKAQIKTEKIDVAVKPCAGCITIANLLSKKQSYSTKVIRITGKVTKYNPAIMGKNWVHIQDGTEFEGGFDLTVTTDKQVSVGEIITFEGKIVLDKDFGYGYFYNVLMEEGKPVL